MTHPLVRLLERATFTWFALVALAVICTVTGQTNASLWIIPCALATVFLAGAAGLAKRSVRKQAANDQEGRPA